MSLFQLGPCTLPSGRFTNFKIECDQLGVEDWDALAALAVEILPAFGTVEGVPRGGIPFARALEAYAVRGTELLIAEDVWVEGISMERFRAGRDALGIVAFSRGVTAAWVTSLFQLDLRANEAAYRMLYT